ncbi:MAG: hypothetical protein HYY40_07675 [Bacteroidetes bacterium]|nr:hypothetical protein [Bacteroidota bacterium]
MKYAIDLNILSATDGIGSKNYEGLNFYTNNQKRGSILKDGAFDWLTRSYFHSNSYFDSLVTTWQLHTQHIQTVTALITGDAGINGTLTIGGTLEISGSSSSGSIVSSTGAISFGNNNLTTTGNISADSVTANQVITGSFATGNLVAQNGAITGKITADTITSNVVTAHKIESINLSVNRADIDTMHAADGTIGTLNVNSGTAGTLHASSLHADTFSVAETSTFSSLTDTTNGIAVINKYGRLQRLNFSDKNNDVLFGNGTFGSLGTATGWQWVGSDLVSPASRVVVNDMAVSGHMTVGQTRIISNGSPRDTLRSAKEMSVVAVQNLKLESDTISIKGLNFTNQAGVTSIASKQADTIAILEPVRIGSDTSKYAPPPAAQKIALDISGNMRTSGSLFSRNYMFDDNKGIQFFPAEANQPPFISIGGMVNGIPLGKIPPPPCSTVGSDPWNVILRNSGPIQSLAVNGTHTSALTLTSVGWGGHGLIEVEGTDANGQATNGLMINYFCGRNTLINTNSGLANKGGTVFMGQKVSMAKSARIGYFGTAPVDSSTALAIEVNPEIGYVSRNGIKFYTWDNSAKLISIENPNAPDAFTVLGGGKVGIGTATIPTDYLLAVKGKIIAQDVVIKLADEWPDYVYLPNYKRPTWMERKNYHQEHNRMMYMEGAPDINEKGITLSRNMIGLTRNMEEAWLEIIELHEENEELKEEINALKKENRWMKEEMKKIRKIIVTKRPPAP